jgi:thiol-disulfide isomerase/thioredoxin
MGINFMKDLKKLLLLLAAVVCFNVSQAQDIPKWKLQDMKDAISNAEQPTIFNFWATFCKPCLEEMPYFQELTKKYEKDGVKLVLVSLDMSDAYPKKIQSVASKFKITNQITFLDETNADLFCPAVDPSWSGSIPASLFINNKTGYRKFFEDQLSKETLEKQIREMIREPQ